MMDFSSSFKKTFLSHNSYKHLRKISINSSEGEDARHEQQPILSYHNRHSSTSTTAIAMNHHQPMSEVIVKIDDGNEQHASSSSSAVATTPTNTPNNNMNMNKNMNSSKSNIWRESSLELWRDDAKTSMQHGIQYDPPSKLIGQFLSKQKASGEEVALDMDLEMDELRHDRSNASSPCNFSPVHHNFHDEYNRNRNSPSFPTSKEIRVSFQASHNPNNVIDIGLDESDNNRRNNGGSSSDEDVNYQGCVHNRRRSLNVHNSSDEGQVLRCTSIQKRAGGLGRLKTRSRLMDPPEVPDRKSGSIKSNQMRSGMLSRVSGILGKPHEDEEEDPLFDEDFPEEYKKDKFDALTIAQWISLILILTSLSCTLALPKWKKKKLRGLSLWKWEVLILVLICGRLVSGWGIRTIVFFIERNFFMRKRILYFVYGVRKAVQNCIWLGLVLIAWHYMFDKKVDGNNKFLKYVNKLMVCMLVGILLWLVKTLMVKVLASSFHVSRFFDRIQESLFNQYVIETLSCPPLIEIWNHQEEEDRTIAEVWRLQNAGAPLPPDLRPPGLQCIAPNGLPPKPPPAKGLSFKINSELLPKLQEDPGISMDQLHKLNPHNISAWNMKRLINVVKNGALSTLDEQVHNSSVGDEAATQIRSEFEAVSAARKIFRNVAKPRAKFIYLEDLMRFLRKEEAFKMLNIVDGSAENDKISKASLKNWVVNAFRERRALALSLNDTKTAVKKLHQMVNVIVGIIIFLISLVILEIATSKNLLFISSQIMVVAFIFGNTCKNIFEAVIFVFIMHPFDVGDRCEVDGVQMIVEEMNILTTIFLRYDNQKILYPNVTLATKAIGNFYRSPDMGDSIDFVVHIATPLEKISVMKERIISYLEAKNDHWYPAPSVVLMNLEDLSKLKLSVWLRHRINHQDNGEKWKRRALVVEEMVKIFKELDIEYRLYPLDINIRAMPPPLNSNRMPPSWTPSSGN